MKNRKSYLLLMAACFCAAPAFAQPAATAKPATPPAAVTTTTTTTTAPAADSMADPTKAPDWQQRVDLAKKMSVIQPTSEQVSDAVDQLSQRLPPDSRAAFKQKIMGAIDTKKLEQVSVDAMAKTFTVAELQRMVDYFSTPEARSIAQKMPIYQQLIQPEIYQMMDAAVMQERTGAAGETAPASQAPVAGGATQPKAAVH